MAPIPALRVKTYINLGAAVINPDTGNWWELACVRAEALDLSPHKIEANLRGTDGWMTSLTGLKRGHVPMTLLFDIADPGFQKIKQDTLTGSRSQFAVMHTDLLTPGSEGLVSVMNVTEFVITRDYDRVLEVSLALDPYFDGQSVAPFWYVVPQL